MNNCILGILCTYSHSTESHLYHTYQSVTKALQVTGCVMDAIDDSSCYRAYVNIHTITVILIEILQSEFAQS